MSSAISIIHHLQRQSHRGCCIFFQYLTRISEQILLKKPSKCLSSRYSRFLANIWIRI